MWETNKQKPDIAAREAHSSGNAVQENNIRISHLFKAPYPEAH